MHTSLHQQSSVSSSRCSLARRHSLQHSLWQDRLSSPAVSLGGSRQSLHPPAAASAHAASSSRLQSVTTCSVVAVLPGVSCCSIHNRRSSNVSCMSRQPQRQSSCQSSQSMHRLHCVVIAAAGKGFGSVAKKSEACPCGSGRSYQDCCGRYHTPQRTVKAPTAEALLRARFSAYAKRNAPYIMATTHNSSPSKRGSASADGKAFSTFEEDVKVSMLNNDFLSLSILNVEEQEKNPAAAEIDLRIEILQKLGPDGKKIKGIPRTITERASFVQEDGEWFFVTAVSSDWDRDNLRPMGEGVTAAAPSAQAAAPVHAR